MDQNIQKVRLDEIARFRLPGYTNKPTGGGVYAHSADKYVAPEICQSCEQDRADILEIADGKIYGLCHRCYSIRQGGVPFLMQSLKNLLFLGTGARFIGFPTGELIAR